jgi:GT2 family glycosyltransferase
MVRFSVLIVTLGRPDVLRDTLRNVLACDPPPGEVIVVDGDPEQSARAVARELGVRYVRSEAGLTRQRNRGLSEASGEMVVFLDDDVHVEPGLFAALDHAYRDGAIVGATGRVLEPDGHRIGGEVSALRRLLPGGGDEGAFTRFGYPRYLQTLDQPRDVEYMLGCFMSARREIAQQVRFDESLGHYALAEDEDFSYRLSRLGRIRYVPEAVVHHKKFGFLSYDSREFGRLVVRNRAYLFRKNFAQTRAARVQFVLFVLMLVAHRTVNREWSGARGVLEGALQAWRRRQ